MNRHILQVIETFVDLNSVQFMTCNADRDDSKDLDIYIVVNDPLPSKVEMFNQTNDMWTEIFIDNETDLIKKLDNYDEIAINFITELDFTFGDKHIYDRYYNLAKERKATISNFPLFRKDVIRYRIKVLSSKYEDPANDDLTSRFLLNSLSYHVAHLLLLNHYILPSSPKRWVHQLKLGLSPVEFTNFSKFINNQLSYPETIAYLYQFTEGLGEFSLDKSNTNNSLTYIS